MPRHGYCTCLYSVNRISSNILVEPILSAHCHILFTLHIVIMLLLTGLTLISHMKFLLISVGNFVVLYKLLVGIC